MVSSHSEGNDSEVETGRIFPPRIKKLLGPYPNMGESLKTVGCMPASIDEPAVASKYSSIF